MPGIHPASPYLLPSGNQLWFSTAVPSVAGDGTFLAGDMLLILGSTAGARGLLRCTLGGSGAVATWQPVTQTTSNVVSKAGAYTATSADDIIILTANAAIAMPLAATVPGQTFAVKRVGAANGTVTAAAIDGGTTVTFGSNMAAVSLFSDGTQYYVINSFGTVTVS